MCLIPAAFPPRPLLGPYKATTSRPLCPSEQDESLEAAAQLEQSSSQITRLKAALRRALDTEKSRLQSSCDVKEGRKEVYAQDHGQPLSTGVGLIQRIMHGRGGPDPRWERLTKAWEYQKSSLQQIFQSLQRRQGAAAAGQRQCTGKSVGGLQTDPPVVGECCELADAEQDLVTLGAEFHLLKVRATMYRGGEWEGVAGAAWGVFSPGAA